MRNEHEKDNTLVCSNPDPEYKTNNERVRLLKNSEEIIFVCYKYDMCEMCNIKENPFLDDQIKVQIKTDSKKMIYKDKRCIV